MDYLRIMGFLLLLFTALFPLQFAEARVFDHHFHNAALSHHNSPLTFDSDLEGTFNKLPSGSSPGDGHTEMAQESESKNSTIMNILPAGPSPGGGNSAINGRNTMEKIITEGTGIETFNKLPSGPSPGVGHSYTNAHVSENIKITSAWPEDRKGSDHIPKFHKLPGGPSPGAGNAHTSAVGGTQSQSRGTFNKLPSGSSPVGGHKVTNDYTEKAQESESKKSTIMNILPAGPSPGGGNSATNGRKTMETLITEKDEEGTGIETFNKLPSGPSPGVGHSYTNAHVSENIKITSAWPEDRKGSDRIPKFHKRPGGPSPGAGNAHTSAVGGTQSQSRGTFNKLPSGSSPGGGHKVTDDYTETAQESESKKSTIMNILPSGPSPGGGNSATNGRNTMEKIILPENIKIASSGEDRKGSDHIPIFHKLPGGPSPGGGHSSTAGALDQKIGCDAAHMDRLSNNGQFYEESNLYGTPTPRMLAMAAGRRSGISKL